MINIYLLYFSTSFPYSLVSSYILLLWLNCYRIWCLLICLERKRINQYLLIFTPRLDWLQHPPEPSLLSKTWTSLNRSRTSSYLTCLLQSKTSNSDILCSWYPLCHQGFMASPLYALCKVPEGFKWLIFPTMSLNTDLSSHLIHFLF